MYTYYIGGMPVSDELYHDDLDAMTFGRRDQNELYHHGIKGQSWGKRRFQNEDGSLTAAGRNRYDVGPALGNAIKGIASGVNKVANGFNKTSAINKQTFAKSNGSATSSAKPTTSRPAVSQPKQTAAKVSNSANNGRKAADNLFNRVGSAASSAANQAKRWGTQTANNVANTATNVYGNARNWAGQAANDVRNFGQQAYNDASKYVDQNITGNSARERAEGLNKAAYYSKSTPEVSNNLRNEAQSEQAKADKTLFGRIGNAANDAKNWAGARANDVGNWATNRANDVSGWTKNQAENVKDWYEREITGDRYRRDADNMRNNPNVNPNYSDEQREQSARESEKRADNSLLGRIRSAGDAVGDWGRQAGRDIANTATNAVNSAGDWVRDTASGIANTPEYRDAANGVNSAIDWVGARANDVRNWGRQAGRDIANTATNAVNDAKDWGRQAGQNISNTAGDVANAVKNAPQNVSDWYTGRKYGEQADSLERAVNNYQNTGHNMVDQGWDKMSDFYKIRPDQVSDLRSLADYAYANALYNKGEGELNRGQEILNQARNLQRDASAAEIAYNNAPRQQLSAVGDWFANRASDARDAVSGAYNDTKDWVGDRASDIDYAVDKATKPIRDWYTGDADKRSAQYNRAYADGITNFADKGINLIDNYKGYAEDNRKAIGNRPDYQTQYYQDMAEQARAAGNYEAAREWQSFAKEAQKEADKNYENQAKYWDTKADETQRKLDRYNNAAADAEQRYNQAPRQVISNLPSNVINGGKAALDKLFKK